MNTSLSAPGPQQPWTFEPAGRRQPPPGIRVLYLESYGAGSHKRIARLIQEHSSHQVDVIFLAREHWRWLAVAGHRALARAVEALDYPPPDIVVCSGPASATKIVSMLPPAWGSVTTAAYFHESQWSYPAGEFDPRPYLVDHLETLETVDRVWFNSRFHQRDFRQSALASQSTPLRKLASEVIDEHWHKTRLLYPPVAVNEHPHDDTQPALTIAWAARWEREKRPDIFVDALLEVAGQGIELVVHILGSPSGVPEPLMEIPAGIRQFISGASGFPDRRTYESILTRTDVWVSTAEHEFFGVAAVEAALLGATPILPRALAYPETLPSAPSYSPGDHIDLARTIVATHVHPFRVYPPWRYDAERFLPARSVACFDRLVEEAIVAR